MKRYLYGTMISALTVIVVLGIISCQSQISTNAPSKTGDTAKAKAVQSMKEKEIESYTCHICPMYPDVLSSKPSDCPACGMTMVKKQVPSSRMMQALQEIEKLNTEGMECVQKSEYDKAMKCFNAVLAKYPTNPGTLYNIACTCSLIGDKEKSVTYLTKAVNNGYNNWEWMEQDKDLDNIRNEKAYQKIIGELKSEYGNRPKGGCKCKEGGCGDGGGCGCGCGGGSKK
ncbi:MAG: heavy metal-binding domain-containing protein [Planctomycetota bacterium]